jgi:hypothetical protein
MPCTRIVSVLIAHEPGEALRICLGNHPMPGIPENHLLTCIWPVSVSRGAYYRVAPVRVGEWSQEVSSDFARITMAMIDKLKIAPGSFEPEMLMVDGRHVLYDIDLGERWSLAHYHWSDDLPPGWEPLLDLVKRLERVVSLAESWRGEGDREFTDAVNEGGPGYGSKG